jgi:hypothetical protein
MYYNENYGLFLIYIFPFFSWFLYIVLDEVVLEVATRQEMMFWHNLQIKITTEAEHTLRTDTAYVG